MDTPTTTQAEARWIKRLKRLMQDCPESLVLFADGSLNILRAGPDGDLVRDSSERVDNDYLLDSIDDPIVEGGGW